MPTSLRKFALTAHVAFSVGWLGAIVPYLALAIAGLTSQDTQIVRAAYISMGLIGSFVIVPLSLAALLSGLIQSLGTPWGLFRHWWVLAKFVLTTLATAILLTHMQTVTSMWRIASDAVLGSADFRAVRIQLIVHAAGGLLVLLAAVMLSVFKPWGMTPYGMRKASQAGVPVRPTTEASLVPEPVLAFRKPRWATIIGVHAVILVLVFIILHLTGLVPNGHGHHGH